MSVYKALSSMRNLGTLFLAIAVIAVYSFRPIPVWAASNPSVIAGSDAVIQGSATNGNNSSVTVASSGSNEVFVVTGGGPGPWSAATLGGVSATAILGGGDGTCQYENVAYWKNPPTGSQTLAITYTGSGYGGTSLEYFTLQDAGDSDGVAQLGASSASSISKALTTTTDGDLVFATLLVGAGASSANTWSATNLLLGHNATGEAVGVYTSVSYEAQATHGSITASYNGFTSQCPGILVTAFKLVNATPSTVVSDQNFFFFGF